MTGGGGDPYEEPFPDIAPDVIGEGRPEADGAHCDSAGPVDSPGLQRGPVRGNDVDADVARSGPFVFDALMTHPPRESLQRGPALLDAGCDRQVQVPRFPPVKVEVTTDGGGPDDDELLFRPTFPEPA